MGVIDYVGYFRKLVTDEMNPAVEIDEFKCSKRKYHRGNHFGYGSWIFRRWLALIQCVECAKWWKTLRHDCTKMIGSGLEYGVDERNILIFYLKINNDSAWIVAFNASKNQSKYCIWFDNATLELKYLHQNFQNWIFSSVFSF